MKIAVINFSGNVGKTTIANYLLAPRMNAKLFTVETINYDESFDDSGLRFKGKSFIDLQEELLYHDSAIVDIGSSNVETLALYGFRGLRLPTTEAMMVIVLFPAF
jgi:hypothetical protein